MATAGGLHLGQQQLRYRNILVVVKQTAYEEYQGLKLRGQAPKALRWERLKSRYEAHQECVQDLFKILQRHNVNFGSVNRVSLARHHLEDVDLLLAVGGDGTALSSAHFVDHGTIPLLGVNSDPMTTKEDKNTRKKSDERRSHGALCMCTSVDMDSALEKVLYGGGKISERTRINCTVKSTFSETRLVPALNDLLIANPSPAAVSRFRMGWLKQLPNVGRYEPTPKSLYGTITRFGGIPYDVTDSLNIWSSGMWVSTATGSTAAMTAAGGKIMDLDSADLQFLIREHMLEDDGDLTPEDIQKINNDVFPTGERMHLRWNSQKGRIFIDGSHLMHNLELGDEIMVDNTAPPLRIFSK